MSGIDALPPSGPTSPLPNGAMRVVPLARTAVLQTGAPPGPASRASKGTITQHLGLIQPDLLDEALITELNYNFGVLDDAILQNTAGTLTGYTLVDPVLVHPAIDDFSLAQHTHIDALGGGALDGSAIVTGTIGTGPLLRQSGGTAVLNVAPPLNLDGLVGTARGVVYRTGTPVGGYTARWFAGADASPETGDGSGSDYAVVAASDAGVPGSAPALLLKRLTNAAVFGGDLQANGPVGAKSAGTLGVAFWDDHNHAWRSDGQENLLFELSAGKVAGWSFAGEAGHVWVSEGGLAVNDSALTLAQSDLFIQAPGQLRMDGVGEKLVLFSAPDAAHYGIGVESATLTLGVGSASDGVGFGVRGPAWAEYARINAAGTVKGQALAPGVWLPGIAWEPGASPPTQRLETDGDARRWVWRFATGATNYMHCPTPIPVKYNGGTVRFTLYWRSVGGGGGFNWRAGASIRGSGSGGTGNGVLADTGAVSSTGANTLTITTWTWAGGAYQGQEFIWYVQRMDSNGQAADVEGLYIEFGV